mgnify:CR=1 FL=1
MTIKEINETLEQGESLKQVAQAYSDIANLKIKRIRARVEQNRLFFQEVSKVYALIKQLAAAKKLNTIKPKKRVCIVLTSNHRFYGVINSDLLEFFVASTEKLDTDIICLGKTSIDYFKAHHTFKNYAGLTLNDDQPTAAELTALINILKEYSQVLVFYSSLKSLLIQQPTISDITASSQIIEGDKNTNFKFIFEPELSKILEFFDSQILTSLLEGTFLESELSRTASRFISMDSAETEANKFIKEYQKLKAIARRNTDNNTILENFATMMAARRIAI